jgi:hypothetical protein
VLSGGTVAERGNYDIMSRASTREGNVAAFFATVKRATAYSRAILANSSASTLALGDPRI